MSDTSHKNPLDLLSRRQLKKWRADELAAYGKTMQGKCNGNVLEWV